MSRKWVQNIDLSGLDAPRYRVTKKELAVGRPLRCNVCCVDTNDPTADLPPVTDCGGVIAVAFIDESDKPTDMNSKIVQYLAAFPDRLLFIMDVEKG